ncbi:response regulator [Devriesea agamarum]|uniref:response regulator n=1 Tax=Devriesea agamarum TaxID=472569 RepID=UPI00071CFF5D|nr:response regulator transcription factor [Devriesea agamarum]
MTSTQTTVLIADDHAIVRMGLRGVLDAAPDLTVVAEAATAAEALSQARLHRADVVLLDLQYHGHTERGTDVIPALLALEPTPVVIVLTTYDNDQDVLEALDAGARSYLLKDLPPQELLSAIRQAAAGRDAVDRRVAKRLAARGTAPASELSRRELDVLHLVAQGHTNADIAKTLFLSQATVKTHLVHIFSKLHVSSRTGAVAAARERGLLRPGT